jgi:glyoxylase-like metal-dependent hydrolase (beta-lactamase superfamily II)
MKRLLFRSIAPATIAALACAVAPATLPQAARAGVGPRAAQAEEVEIAVTHVAGNVHMLTGRGGNIGVSVGRDGILLVDDQFAPLAPRIRAALAEIGEGAPAFVLNTHFHGDHTGGNPGFGKEATIIAHVNVRERLSTPQEVWGETRPPIDAEGWPVITFDESMHVHFNDEEIVVVHAPRGHTDGDAIVYFTRSNVLHMGDQLFTGHFPYVDLDHGGTVAGYLANIEEVLEMGLPEDVKVIVGHGPLSTLDDVRAQRDMIEGTVRIVRGRMAEGKSLDQIKQEGLPAQYASFDWNFIPSDTWMETIHRSYKE